MILSVSTTGALGDRMDLIFRVGTEHGTVQQIELYQLRLLLEAMSVKAKGELKVSLVEVKRRIAARRAASDGGN
jgi:hypothetical protein